MIIKQRHTEVDRFKRFQFDSLVITIFIQFKLTLCSCSTRFIDGSVTPYTHTHPHTLMKKIKSIVANFSTCDVGMSFSFCFLFSYFRDPENFDIITCTKYCSFFGFFSYRWCELWYACVSEFVCLCDSFLFSSFFFNLIYSKRKLIFFSLVIYFGLNDKETVHGSMICYRLKDLVMMLNTLVMCPFFDLFRKFRLIVRHWICDAIL